MKKSLTVLGSIVTAVFFVFSSAAQAACSGDRCDNVIVDFVTINSAGVIFFGTSGDEQDLICSAPSDLLALPSISTNFTEETKDRVWSFLITAKATAGNVNVALSPSGNCEFVWINWTD